MSLHTSKEKGFTLLVAIVTTSILLLVSFVVSNVALKQLVLAYSGQESQYSFYAADSGVECARYWDTHYANGTRSAFDPVVAGSVTCNNQTIATGGSSSSTFSITLPKGCVTVTVTKQGSDTTIDSRGYNTACSGSLDRKFERGITLTY